MITVKWVKCGDHWCSLEHLKLESVKGDGVYVIWFQGNPPNVVRVGQGHIAERLGCHRADAKVTAYAKRGILRVTWASVSANLRDGVERYLADRYSPLIGDCYPAVAPIAVNLPGA